MSEKKNSKLWLSNADEIGAAIGCSRHQVPRLVEKNDLPAFKFLGRWTALLIDLQRWCNMQRTIQLKKTGLWEKIKPR